VPNNIKNVFISHIHEDDEGLGKLKNLLAKNGMQIRDGSINSSNPNNANNHDYIKREILAPKINWSSVMLVYISPKTKDSSWVNWEIEYAVKQGKRIVGVFEYGVAADQCELPDALIEYADAVRGWNGNSIIDAINGASGGWEKPDGSMYSERPIKRHPC